MLRTISEDGASEAHEVVAFWKEAGIELWFAQDDEFDARFRARFKALYERAIIGELDHWITSATGSLALILLLDQYPRNSFRGSPRTYATDAHARRIAWLATEMGQDMLVDRELRLFMYLPFGHSEDIRHQEKAAELVEHLGPEFARRAQNYVGIIRRFGRFPHRNAILNRPNTPEEELFLRNGGFSG